MNTDLSTDEVEEIVGKPIYLITADNKSALYRIANKHMKNNKIARLLIHYQDSDDKYGNKGGHWVAMTIIPYLRKIYFFDSYGTFPDRQEELINPKYRKETGQDSKKLGQFLYRMVKEKGYKIIYNEFELQDMNTAVCGRYAGTYLKYGIIPPDEFGKFILKQSLINKITPDELIYKLTK